jgi:hypothetical protein
MSHRHVEWLEALGLVASLACAGSTPEPALGSAEAGDADVTRYRLLLRANPVDPGLAFRCYGACQQRGTPESYVDCLAECPGFERTQGVACTPAEVPPVAACFTARAVPRASEPDPNVVVVAVIADVALVVGLAAVCASQTEPCGNAGAGLVP